MIRVDGTLAAVSTCTEKCEIVWPFRKTQFLILKLDDEGLYLIYLVEVGILYMKNLNSVVDIITIATDRVIKTLKSYYVQGYI